MTNAFAEAGAALLAADPIERHPLFVRLAARSLPPDAMRGLALQIQHVGAAFPRFVAAMMANVADWRHRMPLAENVFDEHGRLEPQAVHVQSYRRFLQGIGIPEAEIDASRPAIPVIAYNRAMLDLCFHHAPEEGLAALAVIEGIVSRVSPLVIAACAPLVVVEGALEHFEQHSDLDAEHSDGLYEVLSALCRDPGLAERGMALGSYYQRRLYTDLLALFDGSAGG